MDPTTAYYTRNNQLGFPTRSLFEETAEKVVVSTYCCNVDDTESLAIRTDDTVPWKDLNSWLDTPRTCPCEAAQGAQAANRKHAVFQVTWVPLADDLVNTYMHTLAPESGIVPLVEKLGFTNMRNRLSTSCFSLFTGPTRSSQAPDVVQYGLGLFDTPLYLTWDYNETTGRMRAVCWGRPPSHRELDRSIFALKGNTLCHPLAPAVVTSLTIFAATSETFNSIFVKLRDVEASTGYHSFRKFREQSEIDQLDFRSLSARASSTKSSLAASNDAVQALADGVDLIYAAIAKPSASPPVSAADLTLSELRMCLEHMMHGLAGIRTRRESMLIRTEAQITAIFHLITQEDTKRSIQLAESSTALAADSRALAEAASRDAKAMKTLAVVTMIYLPPTAIATIFSMPFFDWGSRAAASHVKGTFWIYWAIAVPLTVATVLVWWVWIRRADDFKTIIDRIEARIRGAEDDAVSGRSSWRSRKSRSPDSASREQVVDGAVAGPQAPTTPPPVDEKAATTTTSVQPDSNARQADTNSTLLRPAVMQRNSPSWRNKLSRRPAEKDPSMA